MTGIIEDGTEASIYDRIINEFVIPSVEMQSVVQRKTTDDLKVALSDVLRTKNALSGLVEDRMVPSSQRKEKPLPFRP